MRLLNIDELRTVKGIDCAKVHIYRMMASNQFPRQIHISQKRVVWLESEIDDWIQKHIEERDATRPSVFPDDICHQETLGM